MKTTIGYIGKNIYTTYEKYHVFLYNPTLSNNYITSFISDVQHKRRLLGKHLLPLSPWILGSRMSR